MKHLVLRTSVLAGGALVALLAGTPSAFAAGTATFTGNVNATCTPPNPPSSGTSTGNGSCDYVGTSSTCTTTVSVPDGTVVVPCVGNWDGSASLFFLLVRAGEQEAVQTFCAGSGSGTFHYKPSASAPYQNIPITITVLGQTGTFSGSTIIGTSSVVVHGTFTAACGGYGTYQGDVA